MSYDQYDPGGLTVEELSNQLMALQSRLASTISDVKREDGEILAKQSQILQDIDSINLNVSAFDSRIGAAEASISLQSDEINLMVREADLTGNYIVSLINLTSTTATIAADNINLVGAVTVLSDITGNLGTITAGNIDLNEGIKIGEFLWLGQGFTDSTPKYIYFNNDGYIRTTDGLFWINSESRLDLDANTSINFNAQSYSFNSGTSINFNNIPVTGLNVTVNFG